jgi:hypothetical protein
MLFHSSILELEPHPLYSSSALLYESTLHTVIPSTINSILNQAKSTGSPLRQLVAAGGWPSCLANRVDVSHSNRQ